MSSSAPELSISSASVPTFGGYALQDQGLEGVSFWPRAIARVIDFFLHYLIGFLAGTLFRIMLEVAAGGHIPFRILLRVSHLGLPVFLGGLLGYTAYEVVFTTVHGSTVGKRILSMVVVQDDGSPCRLRSAVIRELGYFVDSIFFGLVGYLAMQKNRQEQRYGDQWADTVVCSRSHVAPENLRGPGRFVVALMFAAMADAAFLMVGLLIQLNG